MSNKKPYPTAPPTSYPQQPQNPYPTASYPQAQYPTGYAYQQPPYGGYGAPGGPGMPQNPPPYNEAPPPYSQYPSQMPPGPPPQAMYPQQHAPTTVVAPGLFDAGARFDGISSHRIPPPPPGVAPNQAQMAAMQGHTVVGTQQRGNWFSGGGADGGYSWGF